MAQPRRISQYTFNRQETLEVATSKIFKLMEAKHLSRSKTWKVGSSKREGKNLLKQFLRLLFYWDTVLDTVFLRKDPSRELQTLSFPPVKSLNYFHFGSFKPNGKNDNKLNKAIAWYSPIEIHHTHGTVVKVKAVFCWIAHVGFRYAAVKTKAAYDPRQTTRVCLRKIRYVYYRQAKKHHRCIFVGWESFWDWYELSKKKFGRSSSQLF